MESFGNAGEPVPRFPQLTALPLHKGRATRAGRATANFHPLAGFSWSAISTEALLAELTRRDDVVPKPKCGSGKKGAYDTAIHVFALFLILTVSTLGM